MPIILLIGRILYASIFILSSLTHFSLKTIEAYANQGFPLPYVLIPFSGLLALLGGLSILLGFKARIGAWLLVIFLIPVTFFMHQFWGMENPVAAGVQMIMFLKNLSLLGGALIITYFGSGPLSLKE